MDKSKFVTEKKKVVEMITMEKAIETEYAERADKAKEADEILEETIQQLYAWSEQFVSMLDQTDPITEEDYEAYFTERAALFTKLQFIEKSDQSLTRSGPIATKVKQILEWDQTITTHLQFVQEQAANQLRQLKTGRQHQGAYRTVNHTEQSVFFDQKK